MQDAPINPPYPTKTDPWDYSTPLQRPAALKPGRRFRVVYWLLVNKGNGFGTAESNKRVFIDGLTDGEVALGIRIAAELETHFPSVVLARVEEQTAVEGAPTDDPKPDTATE